MYAFFLLGTFVIGLFLSSVFFFVARMKTNIPYRSYPLRYVCISFITSKSRPPQPLSQLPFSTTHYWLPMSQRKSPLVLQDFRLKPLPTRWCTYIICDLTFWDLPIQPTILTLKSSLTSLRQFFYFRDENHIGDLIK